MLTTRFSNEEFNTIFQRFNKEVYAGNYHKMPYHPWRLMTKSLAEKCNFQITFTLETDDVSVFDVDNGYRWTFGLGDGSFGTFLFKNRNTFNENNNTTNNEESNFMKFNFDFGPVNASTVRMSMYGMAVKNKAGTWVSYNANSGEIMDVDVFNFDGAKFLYKMPVAINDIAVGDVVIHNGAPMFVVFVPQDGKALTVIDVINGERKDVMLAKSPFGFNFATKVVNFLGNAFNGNATADNPFGNMWMLMAMSGDNKDMGDMLPLMLMTNGGTMDMSNPLMMWALMGNKGQASDMLPWLLMANSQKPAHTCACGGNCGHTQAQN